MLLCLDLLLAIIYDVINRCALFRVDYQHLVDDVQKFWRIPWSSEWRVVSFNNLLKKIIQRHLFSLILERVFERAEFICDTTERPDIALKVVTTALQDFRWHVQRSSNSWKRLHCLTCKFSSKPEIAKLKVIMFVDENVRRLQVSVHYSLAKHVLQRWCNLQDISPNLSFGNCQVWFSAFPDMLFQITFSSPFDCNKHFVILDEWVDVLGNVWMI